jgi:polysaccharide export outer membrane protein
MVKRAYALLILSSSLLFAASSWAADAPDRDKLQVVVSGEVHTPGQYGVAEGTSLSSLLTQAGGIIPMAADSLYIERTDDSGQIKRYSIDLRDPQRLNEIHLLQAGDKLVVPHALEYSITGEVRRPGNYRLDANLTVTQAIGKAGGVTIWATNRRNFEIERKGADGRQQVVKVSAADFVEPDDVIRVKGRYF